MRCFILILLSLYGIHALGQQFGKKIDVALPDSISTTEPAWADMDNDGLLDIVLISTASSGANYLQVIKADTINAPLLQMQKNRVVSEVNAFVITDYDHDNRMDVVICGKRNAIDIVVVYLNNGSFSFIEHPITSSLFSILKIADLDNDARPEWIVGGRENGNDYVRILKQESSYSWRTIHDTLRLAATAIDVVDQNGDGSSDIFVSGKISPDSVVTTVLLNFGNLFFKSAHAEVLAGTESTADFNSDGTFDFLIMGASQSGTAKTSIYESASGGHTLRDLPFTLDNGAPFAADMNSNGQVDANYFGTRNTSDTVNVIHYDENDYDTLNSKHVVHQQFGDLDHDGDLDLLQVIERDFIHVIVYENKATIKNNGPTAPKNGVALRIYDRMFFYWEKSNDDHTTQHSITYDLHVDGTSTSLSGAFDLLNEKRLTPSHGNNGTHNFKLLRDVDPELDFAVQSIDNSLHAGKLCIGSRMSCLNIVNESLSVCMNESPTFEAPAPALWFSFSKGFLGEHTSLQLAPNERDTIFYYSPVKAGCDGIKTWVIDINNDTLKMEFVDKFACENDQLEFNVEPGWDHIMWRSAAKGELDSTSTIQYQVTQPDSVIVTLSNDEGCVIVRKTAIKISTPVLSVIPDNVKIFRGGSIQLMAAGASRYEWTPATGLNHVDVAAPIAAPLATTVYTVTGYDSLNCTDQAVATVIVEDASFIPNLFTPNDDGKNDELRIYGLTAAKDFLFTIYNREGSLVFKTSDVTEAVQRGWDGTKGGSKQPAGVYFWKVKGELTSGARLQLNGKDSGSIVLVR